MSLNQRWCKFCTIFSSLYKKESYNSQQIKGRIRSELPPQLNNSVYIIIQTEGRLRESLLFLGSSCSKYVKEDIFVQHARSSLTSSSHPCANKQPHLPLDDGVRKQKKWPICAHLRDYSDCRENPHLGKGLWEWEWAPRGGGGTIRQFLTKQLLWSIETKQMAV